MNRGRGLSPSNLPSKGVAGSASVYTNTSLVNILHRLFIGSIMFGNICYWLLTIIV